MKGNLEELTLDELAKMESDTRRGIRVERFKSVTGKPDNTKLIKELKKKIARVQTVKREYELGISKIIIYCVNESTLLLDKSEALDVLKGRKSNKIITLALDELDTYSALSQCSEEWLKNFINELISQNYLQIKHNSRKELLTLNENMENSKSN